MGCVLYEALFPGAESQRLFDVEIGQFESIAFNFLEVAGTPLVYRSFIKEINLFAFPFWVPFFLFSSFYIPCLSFNLHSEIFRSERLVSQHINSVASPLKPDWATFAF